MSLIWLTVLFLAILVAVLALGIAVASPGPATMQRMLGLLGRTSDPKPEEDNSRFERVLEPLGRVFPKSEKELSGAREQLVQAGYRESRYLVMYYGLRTLTILVCVGVVIASGIAVRRPLLLLLALVVSYLLPPFLLRRMVAKRRHKIQLALPDALDLAVICVEAGLGLNGAINRIAEEMKYSHPALSEEFALVNVEMRAGHPRADSLRNMAARTGVEDIRSFVAVLIQTDKFGTSIANTLRVFSDSLRTERRRRAEEQAAKTTIKMVPVLALCVLPALFCVTLGPAAVQLYYRVFPVLNKP